MSSIITKSQSKSREVTYLYNDTHFVKLSAKLRRGANKAALLLSSVFRERRTSPPKFLFKNQIAWGKTFLLQKGHTHTHLCCCCCCYCCLCASLWKLQREKDSKDTQTKPLRVCACKCALVFLNTRPLWNAHAHTHAQNHTGNWAENCCVTGVCLTRPPHTLPPTTTTTISTITAATAPLLQPLFIFRVFGEERKQLLCTLSKTAWVDERKRERDTHTEGKVGEMEVKPRHGV